MFLTLKLLKLIRESKAEEWNLYECIYINASKGYKFDCFDGFVMKRPYRRVFKLTGWLVKRALNKKLLEKKQND